MKRLILYFMILALTSNLFAEEDELFSIGGKLHFSNGFDLTKGDKTYARYLTPQINVEASLESNLSEMISFDTALTSSRKETCLPGYYVKKAKLSLSFHELFSLDAGCLKLEQGAWSNRGNTDFSPFDTILTHEFWNNRYAKALNLNLNFMGAFRVQLLEDLNGDANEEKFGQVALNTAWVMDFFGTEPIFQVGFYNGFKAFHYSLGIRAELYGLKLTANFIRDHFNLNSKVDSQLAQEELVTLKYKAHQLANPYFKFQHKQIKKGGKTLTNLGSEFDNENWKHGGFVIAFGNKFQIVEYVSSYINMNYKWGKFSADNKSKWDITIGVKGRI